MLHSTSLKRAQHLRFVLSLNEEHSSGQSRYNVNDPSALCQADAGAPPSGSISTVSIGVRISLSSKVNSQKLSWFRADIQSVSPKALKSGRRLTCMSRRLMKPLFSRSHIWKNSGIFSRMASCPRSPLTLFSRTICSIFSPLSRRRR